jgi:hypothetical protein
MTADAIRTHQDAVPFTPFHLVTSSGKSYLVPHPDFLTFSPTGRTCLVYAAHGEYASTLDVLTITEIVPVKRASRAKRKSTHRRGPRP